MKNIFFLACLFFSFQVFANTVASVSDRRTEEKIEMSCLDESCSHLDIIKISPDDKHEDLLGSYELEEYLDLMTKLENKEKLKLKNHFFPIIQKISKLPWSDEEFRIFYFVLSPLTVPLTLTGVAVDVIGTPFMAVDYTIDALDGNLGKKAKKALSQKRNFKITHWRFGQLERILKK